MSMEFIDKSTPVNILYELNIHASFYDGNYKYLTPILTLILSKGKNLIYTCISYCISKVLPCPQSSIRRQKFVFLAVGSIFTYLTL